MVAARIKRPRTGAQRPRVYLVSHSSRPQLVELQINGADHPQLLFNARAPEFRDDRDALERLLGHERQEVDQDLLLQII